MTQAPFQLQPHNPDVLMCIANLSNDEVFTPPELVNQMLDTLATSWAAANNGASIWADEEVTFLDPCTKSGVFLREITKRLVVGLEKQIPDLTERVNHILTKQVYGIAITELTSLLARRSVYCSKYANGIHSVARKFKSEEGNIWFERTEHDWAKGVCRFCGANQSEYARGPELETHAYRFIHGGNTTDLFDSSTGGNMHFDVVIGNPPYQLSDGGGTGSSAMPIYHRFVDQAKLLDPRFVSMVIPSRWYSGGKGLNEFRSTMLSDRHVRYIADHPDSRDAFTGVDVAGGVCYFLWDRDNSGDCEVVTVTSQGRFSASRNLSEFDSFIRDNRVLEIVRKVGSHKDPQFEELVSARNPFGLAAAESGDSKGDLILFASSGDTRIRRTWVKKGIELIDEWKVLLSKTASEHAGQASRDGTKRVFSRVEVMPKGSVSTDSYLVVGPFRTKAEAVNATKYLKTRFVRFLVSSILLTQNISRGMFTFVPAVDFSREWSDQDLYKRYKIDEAQRRLIEATVRSMDEADG